MVDILYELHKNLISCDQAYSIYEDVIESSDAEHIAEILGLSEFEWTAFAQGVPFNVLSRWRYYGWPDECYICKEKIDITRYYWYASEEKEHWIIRHVDCLKKQ